MGMFTDRGQIPCGMTCTTPKECIENEYCAFEKEQEKKK